MVEDLGLSRLGLGDQGLVQDIEDVLADLLELGLDLLTVVADGGDVLLSTLGLFLLLDRRDDAPGSTSGADNVLVGNGQQVALIDGELAAQLYHTGSSAMGFADRRAPRVAEPEPEQEPRASRTLATSFMYVTISS